MKMREYTPDRWVMLKFISEQGTTVYKVFAGWYGSFTTGDRWKLNSGVTKIEEDGQCYLFHGSSGSVYRCPKESYGLSVYMAGVLESFYKSIEDEPVKLECINEETTNFMEINYG